MTEKEGTGKRRNVVGDKEATKKEEKKESCGI